MASLKAIGSCLGIDTGADMSVLFHLFGFARQRVPTDPDETVTASVSLLQKIRDVQHEHIHLNVIRVGFDGIASADLDEAEEKLDYAVYKIHNIYRQVTLGIGRVEHYVITTAEADGADDIGSEDEASELPDDWSVHNDGIDLFVVRNISDDDFVGRSPVDGSCDKDSKDDGSLAGEIGRDFDAVARTFAHETGHYLGLEHNHDDNECPDTDEGRNNLMCQTGCALSVRDSVVLTSAQGDTMHDHCSVRGGC